MPEIYPRIAGRAGQIVNLNMSILRNGIPTTPYALRRIDIYRGSIRDSNLAASISFQEPGDTSYPFPATINGDGDINVLFEAPADFVTNEIYYDVWKFVGDQQTDLNDESYWISQSGMFWLFDDVWIVDDELQSKRLGFEPLDKKFKRGEIRPLEVALHPLPKYEYNYNKLAPLIPRLEPTITITTAFGEHLSGLTDAPCTIGIKQGRSRNAGYVAKCLIDTRFLLRGMYNYTIKAKLGTETIISPRFQFTVQ